MAYWINTISRDHVLLGMRGGYTQASHGRPHALRRLERGDLIAFYSPRTTYPDGEPLQLFTAIARVIDDEPHQVEMRPGFHPWRRVVEPLTTNEAPARPLINDLTFIRDRGAGASSSVGACSRSERTTFGASPRRWTRPCDDGAPVRELVSWRA